MPCGEVRKHTEVKWKRGGQRRGAWGGGTHIVFRVHLSTIRFSGGIIAQELTVYTQHFLVLRKGGTRA